MFKKIVFTVLLSTSGQLFAQTIKVSTGILSSNIEVNKKKLLDNINTMPFMVGIEYYGHKYFYLSSEIGYGQIGTKGNMLFDSSPIRVKEKFDIFHLNTTFRYKLSTTEQSHVFIGVGPKVDVILDKDFKDVVYRDELEMPNILFGMKSEAGFAYEINRLVVGLNGFYMLNFNQKNKGVKYNAQQYGGFVSVGYKL